MAEIRTDPETFDSLLTKATHATSTAPLPPLEVAAIRATLPLQTLSGERAAIIAEYGLAHGDLEIARRLVGYLPHRLFRSRAMVCQTVERYPDPIPDAALLKWDEARKSGHFAGFCIAQPEYRNRPRPQEYDPWLIGWLHEPVQTVGGRHTCGSLWPDEWKASSRGAGHGIILAYWE